MNAAPLCKLRLALALAAPGNNSRILSDAQFQGRF